MCSPVQCQKCNKVTWSGCGDHIEYALQNVKIEDRCKCHDKDSTIVEINSDICK